MQQAYHQADLGPEAIDFFEPHDLFSIYTALALEAGGFAQRGQAWKLAQDGAIAGDGDIPICTFGGSKARGDTGGATGVFQAAEATMQLQGRAGDNLIADARVGMIQSIGGTGATAVTHIFRKGETS
jgi:acetyl-CoA C-acetyltransferase